MRHHYHNTIQLSEVIATLEVIEVNDDTQQREKQQQDKCR